MSVRPAPQESAEGESPRRVERPRGRRRQSSPRRLGRRGWILLVGLVLFVAVVVLVVLALPLLSAKQEAKSAQDELTQAKTALSAKDFTTAREHIRAARADVDAADGHANGLGSDVWAAVPVAGGAVDDARNLIDALSQTTKVAQIGAKVYPLVMGDKATLVQGERIDLSVLKTVVTQTGRIRPHLTKAIADLHDVSASTPLVGGSVGSARDSALSQLTSVKSSYDTAAPLLKSVPAIVGADGPRSYLLAMLNPSEQRYSGGATLSMTVINFINGYAVFGGTVNVDDLITKGAFQNWRGVPGNTFHLKSRQRVTSATFSPYWSVSGEELLRAFQKAYPQPLNGVIALDLQALANLFAVTGPVDIPGFAPLTSDNLVSTLAGSYDKYTLKQRHTLNAQLVPAFRQKFFEGGDLTKKAQALLDSAPGRHFITYWRDPKVQASFEKLGLTGDLSSTPNDYLGVFTQNTNGSKVDYWQHRRVDSHVQLNADGSADVHLQVTVNNAAPPYTRSVPDARIGYYTRYLGASLGVFLPSDATVSKASINRRPFRADVITPTVKNVYNRSYFARRMFIDAGSTRVVRVSYHVPQAAQQTADGGLVYRLDVDPQDMVVAPKLRVHVTWPEGYAPQSLPTGWNALTAQTASYSNRRADETLSFEIPLAKG